MVYYFKKIVEGFELLEEEKEVLIKAENLLEEMEGLLKDSGYELEKGLFTTVTNARQSLELINEKFNDFNQNNT